MHVPRWLIRAALVTLAALLFGHPWMVLGLWGLFSAMFRFALNRWRGKDWRYIAPWSNLYDRTVMSFRVSVRYFASYYQWWWPNDKEITMWKDGYLSGWPWAKKDIHRAGTIAYIVEVVAFVVVLFLHLK
jgi:hypothetical protein